MEPKKTLIDLKLSIAELDLIIDALEAYPDSEKVQGMNAKDLTSLEKLGRYLTWGNIYPQIEELRIKGVLDDDRESMYSSRLYDIRNKFCLLGEDSMPEEAGSV